MPRGVYLRPETGERESFQCAPGPAGWRYVSTSTTRVDLTVDSRWRPARLELTSGPWTLRGGCAGKDLLWLRTASDAQGTEHTAEAYAFLGDSPAFLITIARSLNLHPGETADTPLIAIEGPSLAARRVTRRWTLLTTTDHPTDLGPLPVQHWQSLDPETAELTSFHLAGDILLSAPNLELTELNSPPNL
ncbi:hypothetical protein [Actinocorallia sp. A-T 12471]|uniref:hypothetical protein n=1 Tax=Actinocorallia sp. A-T 12471 TaxID=3089813 RepID=UPI0029D07DB7|nr:hypothetical protein [Actinocorallia sp. A-T 12471]MDX6744597.1 hypothetical protein [Actinocorallia sp. A-T 12471]